MILSKVDDTINIVESYREFAASDLICLDFVSDSGEGNRIRNGEMR